LKFSLCGINEELLNKLSYESQLCKSLKNTLRKFEEDDLVNEIFEVKEFYESTDLLINVDFAYRIKSIQSCLLKYEKYYPIEIQVNTKQDRRMNDWLHIYLYKYEKNNAIGKLLREKYKNGEIINENDFKEVLKNVLSSSKEI
jgi:hypothetical protein